MLNLLNAEFYKLFHSRYFWGIVAFNLFLSSVLLLDSIGETSSLFFASLYNVPILYFWQSSFPRCLLEMTLDKEHCNPISMQAITEDRYYLQNWQPIK